MRFNLFTEDEKNEIIAFTVDTKLLRGYIGCPFNIWAPACSPGKSPCAKLFPDVRLWTCPCNQFPASKNKTINKFWKAME